jgi:hypothetical protein
MGVVFVVAWFGWFFPYMLQKCTVQEAKSLLKNLVRQLCAEGSNSGVNWLIIFTLYQI